VTILEKHFLLTRLKIRAIEMLSSYSTTHDQETHCPRLMMVEPIK
jgi:hypothetical protein